MRSQSNIPSQFHLLFVLLPGGLTMASIGWFMLFGIFLNFYVTDCKPFNQSTFSGLKDYVKLGLRHVESEHTKKHVLVEALMFWETEKHPPYVSNYILKARIAPTNCNINSEEHICIINLKAISTCLIKYLVVEFPVLQQWLPAMVLRKQITANSCTKSQIFPPDDDSTTTIETSTTTRSTRTPTRTTETPTISTRTTAAPTTTTTTTKTSITTTTRIPTTTTKAPTTTAKTPTATCTENPTTTTKTPTTTTRIPTTTTKASTTTTRNPTTTTKTPTTTTRIPITTTRFPTRSTTKTPITTTTSPPNTPPNNGTDVDPEDKKVSQILQKGIDRYNMKSPSKNLYVKQEVTKATYVKVRKDRKLWRIQASIILSDCVKPLTRSGSNSDIRCLPLPDAFPLKCTVNLTENTKSGSVRRIKWECEDD